MASTSTKEPEKGMEEQLDPSGRNWNESAGSSTGIVRHTNPESLNGSQGTGNRKAYEWFDPIVRNRIPELETIITNYFDSMIIDATRIYINK